MTEKIFENKASFKNWLIGSAGIVLTAVSFLGDIQELEYSFSHPKKLAIVMEHSPSYFPEGSYAVSYSEQSSEELEIPDYSKLVMVISVEARLARSNKLIGGLQPLLAALSDFEHSCAINKSNPAFVTAGIWVTEPQNPTEIQNLKEILHKYAVFYAFNDGSGFVTALNGRMGNGISNS